MQRAVAFLAAVALVAYLALRGGGYDLVVRQEVGLIVWWSIAVGFMLGLLPVSGLDRQRRWALAALGALVGWTALSLIWTQSGESSFAELARVLDYGGLVILVWAAVGRDTWRAAAAGLSVGVVSIVVVALAGRLFPTAFPTTAVERFFGPQRLSRPLDYWNAVGCWCAMSIAIALGWSSGVKDRLLRGAALATVPLAGAAVYLTYSRGAVFAAGAGVAAAVVLSPNRLTAAVHAAIGVAATGLAVAVIRTQPAIAEGTSGHGGIVVALALLGACLACGAAAGWTMGLDGPPASSRWLRPGSIAAAVLATIALAAVGTGVVSGAGQVSGVKAAPAQTGDPAAHLTSLGGARSDIWASAWRAFESKPVTGIGPGTFGLWWARDSTSPTVFRDAHSLYLETLAELGVPGALALVATLGALLAVALRTLMGVWREGNAGIVAGLVAAYFAFLVQAGVDWMWESTAVAVVAIGSIALAATASVERRPSRAALRWPRVGAVAIALVGGAIQVPGIVSTDRVRAADDALASGFDDRAAELANQAVSSEPWAAGPYAARAFVELAGGELDRARIDVHRAIDREPTNWEHRLLLARIDIEAGASRAAQRALNEVRTLRPALAEEVRRTNRALRSRRGDGGRPGASSG